MREREDRRNRESQAREERLIAQLQQNARTVPQAVTVQQSHLPKMGADQAIDDFIATLETAFEIDGIDGDGRKKKALLTQLTPELAQSVTRELRDGDVTYDEVKAILLSRAVHTTVAAWEALWAGSNSPVRNKPVH